MFENMFSLKRFRFGQMKLPKSPFIPPAPAEFSFKKKPKKKENTTNKEIPIKK
jgi:hypothetical protein